MRNTYLRLAQLVAGILVAALLGTHMVVIHLDDILRFFGVGQADPTAWDSTIGRAREGVWAGIYIALLAVGLYHGLYGLRGIILELTPSARAERIVTRAFLIFGIIAFIGAAYVPVALLTG